MFKLTKDEFKWCSPELLAKLDVKILNDKMYVSNICSLCMTINDNLDDEFTRSVIKCAAKYLESQNWSRVEYRPEAKCLIFIFDKKFTPTYRKYMNCISPDTSNEYEEWTNEWVNK